MLIRRKKRKQTRRKTEDSLFLSIFLSLSHSADSQMLDRPFPDEPLGHLLPAGAVQLHREPRGRHGRGEDLRAGLGNSRRQGRSTHTHTHTCTHKRMFHKGQANEFGLELLVEDFDIRETLSGFSECDIDPHRDIYPPSLHHLHDLQPRLSFPVSFPQAAPPVPGLPLRDGEGEQRRRLHEEELPGDARVHAALQSAHHAGRRAHVEVRHKHTHTHAQSQGFKMLKWKIKNHKNATQNETIRSRSHRSSVVVCILCTYFFMLTVHNNSVFWQQEQKSGRCEAI